MFKVKSLIDKGKKELANIQSQANTALAGGSHSAAGPGGAPAAPVERPTLPAVASPIAVFPQYVSQATESFVLEEKVLSLSGDSFTITNPEKVPKFEVQGNKFTISGRKVFKDAADQKELFHLKKELIALHSTFYGEDAAGQRLFEVKSKFKIGFGSKANVTFTDSAGKAHSLVMEGNWRDSKSEIIDETTKAVVAVIDRKLFKLTTLFGQQTYTLIVAPGVDYALMCAVCVCFDEKNNDK